ncbi:MHS family MFS transporter [Draconibacterium sp.]|jgi:MFS family permease|nr:MHS family MFS transporter [Luminiphilus sp.]MDB4583922.1 MHS family MFS transporter [Draconibacterium sp.]MDA8659568.1 MHS family MFS transporter [Luminiphilus sp.]MDA8826627.1 MHS family MFS transporter [Luminiphilus sp.]MDB2352722.1 MHS family MFS transporter [Luminiphilus sp.]
MASNHDDKSNMRKVALTSLAGTSIEWYDFFIYGTAAAIVFPKAFFPQDLPPMVLLIISFSTFAVGFVARPVGGIIFGHFGDRVGRKRTLVAALMMMGAATTLIGLLPTYGTIGIAAPLLLVLLRFVQGLAIGGQWGGAMLLVTESAPANKRGWYGAYAQAGAPVGVILANLAFIGVSMSMSDEAFMSWGWRLPFLASIILIGVSLFVQLRLEDTEAFKTLKAAQDSQSHSEVAARSPIVQALKKYPRTIMLAAGAFLSVQVTFYILIAFTVAYGLNSPTVNLSREAMLTAVLIASAVMVPTQFYFSGLSDRLGRKKVYRWGAILTGLWGFALFPLIDTGSLPLIVLGITMGLAFLGMQYGPQAAYFTELFSTEVRYSGASLGYQIGAIVGGALAPTVAVLLWNELGIIFVSIYILLAAVLTLWSLSLLEETGGQPL